MVSKYGREKTEFPKYLEKIQKSLDEIEAYSEAFWKNFRKIENWEN
jgi:hypothetical protein